MSTLNQYPVYQRKAFISRTMDTSEKATIGCLFYYCFLSSFCSVI